MDEIKENSIVQYKGQGDYLTVIEVRGEVALCAWYTGFTLKQGLFKIKDLVLFQ